MKKNFAWCVTLLCIVFVLKINSTAGPSPAPAIDERFCADTNGDGRLDIADAVTTLEYLFNGTATPYCIAQSALPPFATRDEADALRAELQTLREDLKAVPRYVSGKYLGDGTVDRTIETGITGTIRSFWIGGRCPEVTIPNCTRREDYFLGSWVSGEMDPGLTLTLGSVTAMGTRLSGSDLIVTQVHNYLNYEYIWMALATPE